MVTPIFLLGYRPLTFARPPPTRREGADERIRVISARVSSENPRDHNEISSGLSMNLPPEHNASSTAGGPRLYLRALLRTPFKFACLQVANASFLDEILQHPAILNGLLNLRCEIVGHID